MLEYLHGRGIRTKKLGKLIPKYNICSTITLSLNTKPKSAVGNWEVILICHLIECKLYCYLKKSINEICLI